MKYATTSWGTMPTSSAVVVSVALPALSMDTAGARSMMPSLNVTTPVVTGLPWAVTVAVNVTIWPQTAEAGSAARRIEVSVAARAGGIGSEDGDAEQPRGRESQSGHAAAGAQAA